MDFNIKRELDVYLDKIKINSVKESWVKENLNNLYNFFSNKEGDSLSEKIYIFKYKKELCKYCGNKTKFLSYNRGYRDFCSKKCSNNDLDITNRKIQSYKENNIKKWGIDNPSKLENIKEKIKSSKSKLDYEKIYLRYKKTSLENWGVDNPSKSEMIKEKKKKTSLENWGVDNPSKSEIVKDSIKNKNLKKYGFTHPMKNKEIKKKFKKTLLKKYGVDNYTKTDEYKELIFSKYKGSIIKTNLNIDINYHSYLGLGKHIMSCDNSMNHLYETTSHLYHSRLGKKQCTTCFPVNKISSFKEEELYNYIKSIYNGKIIKSYKDGLEIDIYIPDLKIGFEFNGLYWHSELFKDKNYHLDKTNHFRKKGIRIIHIWEDNWDYNKNILKSQISNWIGLTNNKIWARNCQVIEIKDTNISSKFLNENHIQGEIGSILKIGLIYNNELVSLMTFDKFEGRKKMEESGWNLSRFCNKLNTNVVGSASKLLDYFIKNYFPSRIISYADISWSNGSLYEKLGFNIIKISKPNYSYLIDKKRSNKQKWKKSNLVKMGFDNILSESKIMQYNFGAYKIYDCGQIKFEMKV